MRQLPTLLLASVALTACAAAPTTTPVESPLTSADLGLGATMAPAIGDIWWREFSDEQLAALVEQALDRNPTLAAALARMREAQSQLSAHRATTYPAIALDAQEQRQRFSTDLAAAALDAAAARLALSGAVTQPYIGLSRAYALRSLADATVTQRAGVLSWTNTRVPTGLESTAAQKRAEALLALARADRVHADGDLELARHQLAALVGRGVEEYAAIRRPHLDPDALALPQRLPVDLRSRRAGIRAARARVDAALSGRDVAGTAFYPDIDIAALAGWSAIRLDPLFSTSAHTYTVGLAVHLPIFDAGTLRAKCAQATAVLNVAIAQYNGSVIPACARTADALTRLRVLKHQSAEQRVALDAARDSYRLAQIRYCNGLSAQLEGFAAEANLLQAQIRSATLDADVEAQRDALLLAYGGGFHSAPPHGSAR